MRQISFSDVESDVASRPHSDVSHLTEIVSDAICFDAETARPSDRRATRSRQAADGKHEGKNESHRVFIDTQAMKEKVRANLIKPKYNVFDSYCTTGVWQFVARHSVFDVLTLTVIAFNAVWISLDTDHNTAEVLVDADPVFQIAENVFCAYFSLEWFIRWKAFKKKRDGLKDAWFVFDTFMVALMVLETWVLSVIILCAPSSPGESTGGGGIGNASILRVARLMRLSRMARMARLLRAMPELMILIKGMMAACRSVFFTLCLLGLVMFVFAIAFTQLTKDFELGKQYFITVPEAMYTLLVRGTFLDDVANVVNLCRETGWHLAFLFFMYILIATLTVMNMLIGVLCEVVSAVATTEREEMLLSWVGNRLRAVVALLDTDCGGTISKREFHEILSNVDAIKALQDVGVDVVELVDFADFIFETDADADADDGLELSLDEFMDVVLQLRGSNTATVKDIVDLRKSIRTSFADTNLLLSNVQEYVKEARRILPLVPSGTSELSELDEPTAVKDGFSHGVDSWPNKIELNGVEGGMSPAMPLVSSDMDGGLLLEMSDVSVRGRWLPCELPSLQVNHVDSHDGEEPQGSSSKLMIGAGFGRANTLLNSPHFTNGFGDGCGVERQGPSRPPEHCDGDVSNWDVSDFSLAISHSVTNRCDVSPQEFLPLVELCADAVAKTGRGDVNGGVCDAAKGDHDEKLAMEL